MKYTIIILLISCITCFAQDTIYLKNSGAINVEYINVDQEYIYIIKKDDPKRFQRKIPMEMVDSLKSDNLKFLKKVDRNDLAILRKVKFSNEQLQILEREGVVPGQSNNVKRAIQKRNIVPDTIEWVRENIVMINALLYNGFTYEGRIGKKSSVVLGGGIALSLKYEEGFTPNGFRRLYYFFLNPYFELGQRNYYNFQRRNRKGRNTSNNSGNYVGPKVLLVTKAIYRSLNENSIPITQLGCVWGIQRVYESGIFVNFELGLGFSIPLEEVYFKDYVPISAIAMLKFGGVLSKRQKSFTKR